jgi:deazaflavin-dependent oxidoreductase (nitroreductase family)
MTPFAPHAPYARTGRLPRLVRRTAATRPMARVNGRIQQPADALALRLTAGRATLTGCLADVEVVLLTTTGARSGLPRTVPLLGLPDGEAYVVVASNFGRPRDPEWCRNLRAQPEATLTAGGVARPVTAHALDGVERDAQFRRAVAIHPGFAGYRAWAGRPIPVLRLTPRS